MTTTAQPATRVERPCATKPDLWFSDEHTDRALTTHICRSHCPVQAQCAASPAAAWSVQAGLVHDQHGTPLKRQPKPSSVACTTCHGPAAGPKPTSSWDDCGTPRAYNRHKHRGEKACGPCREANRIHERAKTAARRRKQKTAGPCGSPRGLMLHRRAGEDPCEACVAAQREAAKLGGAGSRISTLTPLAQVDTIRRLAGQRLTDPQIGARLHLSRRQVVRIRRANSIPAGWILGHREVAA